MARYGSDRDLILAAATDAFRQLHAEMGRRVLAVFPDAQPVQEHGMAAWAVPVPTPPPADEWQGTMPRTYLTIAPTEKQAGITLHVWHPNRPELLADNADWLKAAGFKPMVGCLQWNRKGELPLDAFDRLLATAKAAMR
jgi:hypothetical protein